MTQVNITLHANNICTYNHTHTTPYRTLHLGKCSKIVNSASSIPLPLVAESMLQPQYINTCILRGDTLVLLELG